MRHQSRPGKFGQEDKWILYLTAARWLAKSGAKRLTVAGESAGGGLTLSALGSMLKERRPGKSSRLCLPKSGPRCCPRITCEERQKIVQSTDGPWPPPHLPPN